MQEVHTYSEKGGGMGRGEGGEEKGEGGMGKPISHEIKKSSNGSLKCNGNNVDVLKFAIKTGPLPLPFQTDW